MGKVQMERNSIIALEIAVWVFRFTGGGEIAPSFSAAGRFDPEDDKRLVGGIMDLVVVRKGCFRSELRGFELDKRRVKKKEVTLGWRQVAIRSWDILSGA
jgi:hypothetical protein